MDALLIHNPTAGPRKVEDELDRVVEYLGECGWRIQRRITEHAGQATEFARQAALDGRDLVRIDFGAGQHDDGERAHLVARGGDHSVLLSTPPRLRCRKLAGRKESSKATMRRTAIWCSRVTSSQRGWRGD